MTLLVPFSNVLLQVTHSLFVPTMFALIVQQDISKFDLSSCKYFLYGGSSMPEAVLLAAMAAFSNASFCQVQNTSSHFIIDFVGFFLSKIIQGYGMTECAPLNTLLPPDCHSKGHPKLTSAGRAVSPSKDSANLCNVMFNYFVIYN